MDYKYERLPSFCFRCGFLGHEDQSCLMANVEESAVQYGDWLRARSGGKARRFSFQK